MNLEDFAMLFGALLRPIHPPRAIHVATRRHFAISSSKAWPHRL